MEAEHQQWIGMRMPALRERTHLLGHWRNVEIRNPMNDGRDGFEDVVKQIEDCLVDWCIHPHKWQHQARFEEP